MTTILVTGGSGGLGSELVPRLAAGHTVRILSRRPRPPSATTEWAQGELATGEGLAEAVAGVDMIVHAASSPFGKTRQVDVEGIRRLLAAAAPATPHLFYISIVGVDRIPFPYYRAKLAAEKLVEESAVPYTILRATQFHTLIDRLLRNLVRFPVALVPKDLKFQVVDTGEVAETMAGYIFEGASGRLPDMGGPEVLSLGAMAREWLRARHRRALLFHLPLPGRAAAAFRRGLNCTDKGTQGAITWADWLRNTYG